MGDRTTVEIEVVTKDRNAVIKRMAEIDGYPKPFDYVEDFPDGTSMLNIDEANYAWEEELQKLAESGFTFKGWHGPGGSYDASSFVAAGGQIAYLTLNAAGEPVLPVDRVTLKLLPKSVISAKVFLDLKAVVEEYFAEARHE